jgi:hypothetical protein
VTFAFPEPSEVEPQPAIAAIATETNVPTDQHRDEATVASLRAERRVKQPIESATVPTSSSDERGTHTHRGAVKGSNVTAFTGKPRYT